MLERAEIRSTRALSPDPISEREWEHDHDDAGDVEGDVDAVPNKLDHADDEDDECHVVLARDVDDGHDGHDDRPWWNVLKKHVSTTVIVWDTWSCAKTRKKRKKQNQEEEQDKEDQQDKEEQQKPHLEKAAIWLYASARISC